MARSIALKARLVILTTLFIIGGVVGPANADFTFGPPTNLGPTVNSPFSEWPPSISADGLSLYFCSDRPGGHGGRDLWVTTRAKTDDEWGIPVNLGSTVNSTAKDAFPSISSDGLSLFFESTRSGGYGGHDLWVTTRTTKDDPWSEPVNLGPIVNSPSEDATPGISADGLSLFFESDRSGGYGSFDLWVTTRATKEDPWSTPANLGPTVNKSAWEGGPTISADGLVLCFWSDGSGGHGSSDIWLTRRGTIHEDWGTPVNLGPVVNTPAYDDPGSISSDGLMLFFESDRPGGLGSDDLWQVSIDPIVDFNGDGVVDAVDIDIMIDFWGTDESLCDIGPMPWGDGIVDVEDLIVLVEHIVAAKAPAVKPEAVDVNEADDGGQVELVVGQMLVVTLESNPSTGYGWEQVEDQGSILEQIGEAEFKPAETGEPPLVGAGGSEIFHFKAAGAGQTTLQLVYHRSWEEGVEPLRTFSIEVVVR